MENVNWRIEKVFDREAFGFDNYFDPKIEALCRIEKNNLEDDI